jgi:hypothetical protein
VNRKLHLLLLTFLLFALGFGLAAYKAFVLRFPILPDSTSSLWTVEANVAFVSTDKPAKVSLVIPKSSASLAVVDENFISHGFGLTTTQTKLNRRAVWSIRKTSGPQRLFYRGLLRQLETPQSGAPPPPKEIEVKYEGVELSAAQSLLAQLRRESADTETFVKALLLQLDKPKPEENLRLLLGKKPDPQKKVVVAARVLNVAGIPARAAHGILLAEQLKEAPIEHWIEVYDKEQNTWNSFHREAGEEQPDSNYLVWWRGEPPLVDLKGGSHLKVHLAISRSQEEAIATAISKAEMTNRVFLDYSLLSLPINSQAVYRVILLVPIGALIIVLLRNVVGIRTFGTFMPVLIALAFRETELPMGIAFFTLLVAFGLAVRFYLEHLKLLLVPRLASIVVVVVLMMAMLSVVTHRLGIERGLSVSLFPMVIMTMTIERMSIVWEEIGAFEALIQGFGSLIAAAIIYIVMTDPYIEHIVFVFPELLLVVLALILLLGRYTGFRLLELHRFRALAKE